MVVFNIHFGQKRLAGGTMVFRPKSPKSILVMQDYDSHVKKAKSEFRADKMGNIEVSQPKQIETMVGLGYPIYNGDGKMCPVPMDDLLYPSIHLNSEYWKRINQATGKSMKEE